MANNETSAIDVAYKVITDNDPTAVGKTYKGYTPSTAEGLIREITESDGSYLSTFAPGIAIEAPEVEIGIRGLAGDYQTPQREAKKLRKLLAMTRDYTLNDVTVMWFEPLGGIMYMGRDENRRVMFTLRFRCYYTEAG